MGQHEFANKARVRGKLYTHRFRDFLKQVWYSRDPDPYSNLCASGLAGSEREDTGEISRRNTHSFEYPLLVSDYPPSQSKSENLIHLPSQPFSFPRNFCAHLMVAPHLHQISQGQIEAQFNAPAPGFGPFLVLKRTS